MKEPKSGIGILVGVKPKKGSAEEETVDDGGDMIEVKRAAVKALFSAMKAGDVEAGVEALDALKDCY